MTRRDAHVGRGLMLALAVGLAGCGDDCACGGTGAGVRVAPVDAAEEATATPTPAAPAAGTFGRDAAEADVVVVRRAAEDVVDAPPSSDVEEGSGEEVSRPHRPLSIRRMRDVAPRQLRIDRRAIQSAPAGRLPAPATSVAPATTVAPAAGAAPPAPRTP
ncbi:MAG: hypothetical protein H6698_01020 [Myxococcales bacterium]|nr:hypothetical protein [Myxococcales bacterium]MCB9530972.1 hypothetical protein [Myxococcales bacterium]MCB9532892.1 hypothetical protein [Myxococcales bacterium]